MIQEMFAGRVTVAAAAGFVGLLSLFNMVGRFCWSSLSDTIGRKRTYTVFFLLGAMYGAVRLTGHETLNLKYLSVKAENESLKQTNDAYQNSYARLKGQISYVEDMSKELARKARMEHSPETDELVGIGGPETVAALDKAADHLEREVRHINDQLRSDILRLASIPRGLPVSGYVTDGFGMRRNPFNGEGREVHEGLDIAIDFGAPVAATCYVDHTPPVEVVELAPGIKMPRGEGRPSKRLP